MLLAPAFGTLKDLALLTLKTPEGRKSCKNQNRNECSREEDLGRCTKAEKCLGVQEYSSKS